MNKRGGAGRTILIVLVVIVLIAAIYFTFFFYYSCADYSCFKAHQEKCSKTKYTRDTADTTWFYSIEGKSNDKCKISVEIVSLKKGTLDKQVVEGKTMDCYLNIGDLAFPESDLSKCHGLLKEELQGIIINKLHNYIVESLGEIGNALAGVPGATNSSA